MRFADRLVGLYLVVVTVTLWLSGRYGPWVSVADSFLGIGLVIVIRARLQGEWGDRFDRRMTMLILAGGVCALAVNTGEPRVALASATAFLVASAAAGAVHAAGRGLVWQALMFAAADSLVFPTVAYGGLDWAVTAAQSVAKAIGALCWALALRGWFTR